MSFLRIIIINKAFVMFLLHTSCTNKLCLYHNRHTRSPAIAEGPRDAGVPVEIW